MSAWIRSSNSRKSLTSWADDVASEVMKEKTQSASSRATRPTASTAVESFGLPPPATHGERYSIASGLRKRRRTRFGLFSTAWAHFKRRLGTGSAPSSSSVNDESAPDSTYMHKMDYSDQSSVDEVVVDRVWSDEYLSTPSNSDPDDSTPEKSGSHDHPTHFSDIGSNARTVSIPERVFHIIMEVFSSRFEDERKERHYQMEDWYVKKRLAIFTSLWLLISWILGCAFTKIPGRDLTVGDKIFLFAVAPVFTVPIIVMVLYNWPRDRPHIYQVILLCAIWCWSFNNIIYMRVCRFYSSHADCQTKDFMATFYWTTGLQTVGLFGLKLKRFPAAIGAFSFFLFSCIAIIPVRTIWTRLLLYVHYIQESSERRLYTLRDQLKIQYKATQKAQVNERKASDSKRRLTSYVFHDKSCLVRVPLNTALLAVQNMSASGGIPKDQELEFNALSGSLSMMSKVLNDVLDFNRLDSGKFESASKPYAFHQVMRSLFIPLRMATDAKQLELETSLDLNIDKMARRLNYEALGQSTKSARDHILRNPQDALVTGDEARLRQIVTNLASNACKFTPPGGKLKITTKLVLPHLGPNDDPLDVVFEPGQPQVADGPGDAVRRSPSFSSTPVQQHQPLSTDHLTRHDYITRHEKRSLEHIVVRIEVSDTGCGIKYEDIATNKLFSAFNQTEQGIQQGGKGTGLGLALVRQIVKVTGGRLGVRSKVGEGSTFWVELPLGVGKNILRSSETGNLGKAGHNDGSDSYPPPGSKGSRGRMGPSGDRFGGQHQNPEGSSSSGDEKHHKSYGLMDLGANGAIDGFANQRGLSIDSGDLSAIPSIRRTKNCKTETETSDGTPVAKNVNQEPPPVYRVPETDTHSQAGDSGGTLPGMVIESPDNLTTTITTPSTTEVSRPTYVALPSPRSFSSQSMENQPPPTNSTYQTTTNSSFSGAGVSPMTAFDNCFTHGSPESSNAAVNVVPGMDVLVVDDDPLTRTLMTRILTRLGCVVTTASNGEQALNLIVGEDGNAEGTSAAEEKEEPEDRKSDSGHPTEGENDGEDPERDVSSPAEGKYAVVFLDNQMPVMSGVRAVEKLREMGRKDFVVGVTGNALLSDQKEYINAGVDRILTKPVLERGLRETLVAAEERRKDGHAAPSSSSTRGRSKDTELPRNQHGMGIEESASRGPSPLPPS